MSTTTRWPWSVLAAVLAAACTYPAPANTLEGELRGGAVGSDRNRDDGDDDEDGDPDTRTKTRDGGAGPSADGGAATGDAAPVADAGGPDPLPAPPGARCSAAATATACHDCCNQQNGGGMAVGRAVFDRCIASGERAQECYQRADSACIADARCSAAMSCFAASACTQKPKS